MEALIDFYRGLFWSPKSMETFGDYFLVLLALLPVWLLIWWIIALGWRLLVGDLRARLGARVGLRLIWARTALLLSLVLLADISMIWYFEKLTSWSAIAPHATLSFLGGAVGLWVAVRLRQDVNRVGTQLFNAKPRANVAAAR